MSFYENAYEPMFYGSNNASRATKFIHRSLEKDFNSNLEKTILEVGGGEGFHVPYVRNDFSKYILSDIEFRPLHKYAANLQANGKLEFQLEDAASLSFNDSLFDRVIFMCVLHHLNDIERSLHEARRVTKNGGVISFYLPCDPGMLYRFLRTLFTRSVAKNLNIDYKLLNAKEHRNHFHSLFLILLSVFENDLMDISFFPFRFRSWNTNIFSIIHVTKLNS